MYTPHLGLHTATSVYDHKLSNMEPQWCYNAGPTSHIMAEHSDNVVILMPSRLP